ncbi:MAG TPA: fumarylacetoacetate hydrolase family protein [Rhizomicrobium sp.]|nr:fumarylacetoacetate hydrolase family protein [Rhizomicrobium sp.]
MSDSKAFPLPTDWRDAVLVGRMDMGEGPTPVVVKQGRVFDVSATQPTVAALLEDWSGAPDGTELGRDLGDIDDLGLTTAWSGKKGNARLLAPVDLQCVKACGVTFAVSAMERVIEERAQGVPGRAQAIREELAAKIGTDIRKVVPGSPQALALKEALIAGKLWSQYLEVAIGPDAEVFTKAPPMSSVGWGDYVGIRTQSSWNNPEPEVVVVVDRAGKAVGATLGNDVNLRDYEGRSALLLGKAKDNNAASALGPFIRMFDAGFTIDDVRNAVVELEIIGADNYRLEGKSSMAEISRDPLELVKQTISEHQYPDGFVLFCGTLFAPTQDRDQPGLGFTHKQGDVVRVSTPKLGVLENRVTTCKAAPPWNFGIADLMKNLVKRGLLRA